MVGFFVFICILVICATIVAAVFIVYGKPTYDAWEVNKRLDKICKEMQEIKEGVRNGKE